MACFNKLTKKWLRIAAGSRQLMGLLPTKLLIFSKQWVFWHLYNFETSRNRTLKPALPPYLQSFCGSLVFEILLVEIGLDVPFCVRKLTVQGLKSALVFFRLSNLIQCVHFKDCTSLQQLHAFLFLRAGAQSERLVSFLALRTFADRHCLESLECLANLDHLITCRVPLFAYPYSLAYPAVKHLVESCVTTVQRSIFLEGSSNSMLQLQVTKPPKDRGGPRLLSFWHHLAITCYSSTFALVSDNASANITLAAIKQWPCQVKLKAVASVD